RVDRHTHARHDRPLDRDAERRALGLGRCREVHLPSLPDGPARPRPRVARAAAALRPPRRRGAHRRQLPPHPAHQARPRDARHVPGRRDVGAHGRADRANPHRHVCFRLGARGRGWRAAGPDLPRLPVDGGPGVAQGLLRRHPRRARQRAGRHARRPAARRRRGAGRWLRVVRLPRRRRVPDQHRRARAPPRRHLRPSRKNRMRRSGRAVAALLALTLPFWLANPYVLHVVIMAGIFAVLALSLNLLLGYTGQLSLGHAAFFGIGAYATALLTVKLEWSPWLGLGAAIAVPGLAGWVIGRLALKIRGAYFVLLTISFAGVISLVSVNWMELTNGPLGLPGVPPIEIAVPGLTALSLRSKSAYYYLVLVAVIVCYCTCLALVRSRVGRAL